MRQKFTQKERDNETGLDYFKARYYSSAQGRFTSVDAPFADQRQTDPSSWNSYAYVRNNPCNRSDPNGRCSPPPGLKPGQIGICIEAFISSVKAEKHGMTGYGDGRGFSGDDASLTAKVRTHIIANRREGPDVKSRAFFDISQKSKAGLTTADNPLAGTISSNPPIISPPIINARGSVYTTLNGQGQASDGTGSTSSAIESGGVARLNVNITGGNGVDGALGTNIMGEIKADLNLTINANSDQVKIAPGSSATNYPSFGLYSYAYQGKTIVTTVIREIPEGSNTGLGRPIPIPPSKP